MGADEVHVERSIVENVRPMRRDESSGDSLINRIEANLELLIAGIVGCKWNGKHQLGQSPQTKASCGGRFDDELFHSLRHHSMAADVADVVPLRFIQVEHVMWSAWSVLRSSLAKIEQGRASKLRT